MEAFIDSLIIKHEHKILKYTYPFRDVSDKFYTTLDIPELIVYALSMEYIYITFPRCKNNQKKMIKIPSYVDFYDSPYEYHIISMVPDYVKINSTIILPSIKYITIWENIKNVVRIKFPCGVSGIITEYMSLKV